MKLFSYQIPLEEKPLLVLKPRWLSYFFIVIFWIIGIGAAGFLVNLFQPSWWSTKEGKIALLIVGIIALVHIILNFWKKFLTAYIVTPCRIIDVTQEKILSRIVTEINLEDIGEIRIKRGLLGKKIHFKLKNNKGEIVFYNISHSVKVRDLILEAGSELSSRVQKEGEDCDVVLKDNRAYKVPLSYSYYGSKDEHFGKGKKESILQKVKTVAKRNKKRDEKTD